MAVLQDQAVDGIILDLGLPDADGLDLLTWARTRIVGLPVLILTARDGIDDACAASTPWTITTKPFNMRELQARLQAMLRARASQPSPRPPVPRAGPAPPLATCNSTTIKAALLPWMASPWS